MLVRAVGVLFVNDCIDPGESTLTMQAGDVWHTQLLAKAATCSAAAVAETRAAATMARWA
jgi:hypothetical protein